MFWDTASGLRRLGMHLQRLAVLGAGLACLGCAAQAEERYALSVVGGLSGLSQSRDFEEPFWTREVPELTGGRVSATLRPFDQSGLRAQDMLQLVRLGVVPYATVLASPSADDEPEINAMDLPILNPDIAALKRTIAAYRPHLANLLRDEFGIELLGVYAYPAQVLFCAKPFTTLEDIRGWRVRTSSVDQSELVGALGGEPVILPFSGIKEALARDVVDCAITGSLSGTEIGLPAVSTHVHAMAITWGVSLFVANAAAWAKLPPELRAELGNGIKGLETRILDAAGTETAKGLACATNSPACLSSVRGGMVLVPTAPSDAEGRRALLQTVVLPRWIERCGRSCADAWRATLEKATGIALPSG